MTTNGDWIANLLERDDREDRFPEWLRNKLSILRGILREILDLRAENKRLRGLLEDKARDAAPGTDTWLEDSSGAFTPLGKSVSIHFGDKRQFTVTCEGDGKVLTIDGDDRLAIHVLDSRQVAINASDLD